MTTTSPHGQMTDSAVGIVMKEMVRRATDAIYAERRTFVAHEKTGYDGESEDMWTSADKAAQDLYEKSIRECFPNHGIIGEEDLKLDAKNGCTAFFAVDPLDGTKAYGRKQSHGISTMIALCDQDEVLAAFIGDINANEVYGYRPGSTKVHRIARLNEAELMQRTEPMQPGEFFALLRDPLERGYSETSHRLIQDSGLVKNYEVMGSSIGTWMARLWKGEVPMLVIPPGFETPWDSNPVFGITQKMGYVYLKPKDDTSWEQWHPPVLTDLYERDHDVLVVHQLDMHHFM